MLDRQGLARRPRRILLFAAAALLFPALARAAEPGSSAAVSGAGMLRQFSGALSQLAARVSPAVVQILVTGYGPIPGEDGRADTAYIVRQHGVGSGVIVDPAGYVVTNAHVVHGAQRVVVVLPATTAGGTARQSGTKKGVYEARVVGTHTESDLAVLKIEATGLPALPLRDTASVKQGELVFAIGSPQGLASTVTLGIISATARQTEIDAPMLFIQTDAPINPGNSGGPLVNADGEVVGINTFILSRSGGSQGLGFAIPAPVVRFVYDGLRKRGHVNRVELGIAAQGITPVLASGLGLERDWGVVVSDVMPGGPAEEAGLQVGDIVDAVDGRQIDSLSGLTTAEYVAKGTHLEVKVLRGGQQMKLQVRGVENNHPMDEVVDYGSLDKHLVRRLGILGIEVDDKVRQLVHLRKPSGVIVAGRTLDASGLDTGLQPGDIVHALNRTPIESVEDLRRAVKDRKGGESVVLQIEREGRFRYLFFETE
jgi:serine protease Do